MTAQRKRPDILAADVAKLYRTGKTTMELAVHFQCSTRTVWNRLHEANEPLAPRGSTKKYPVNGTQGRPVGRRHQQAAWKQKNIERLRLERRAQWEAKKAARQEADR